MERRKPGDFRKLFQRQVASGNIDFDVINGPVYLCGICFVQIFFFQVLSFSSGVCHAINFSMVLTRLIASVPFSYNFYYHSLIILSTPRVHNPRCRTLSPSRSLPGTCTVYCTTFQTVFSLRSFPRGQVMLRQWQQGYRK